MALLFLSYPGFLWWIQGFEYQPMVLSVDLQIFSIVFTLKAIQANSRMSWLLWSFASILCGWTYLAFVEYAIGMEVFRWLCIYLITSRFFKAAFWQRIMKTLQTGLVQLLIPVCFLLWRIFLFENERKAADIGLQTGAVLHSPRTIFMWLIHFVQSSLNVSAFAWVLPFDQNFYGLRLKDALLAIGCMLVVIVIAYLIHQAAHSEADAGSANWTSEAMVIGLIGACAGVLPIVAANRVITFDRFSHYALPASLAVVVWVVGLVHTVSNQRLRLGGLFVLIGLSVLTHYAVATRAQDEELLISNFWHQVVWRAPNLRQGTLLVANYAGLDYEEGNDIVWGPANLIYYPESQDQIPITIPVAAARMEADVPKDILEGLEFDQNYIVVNTISYNFNNLLVMSMPTPEACVHVIDKNWEELSVQDTALIDLAASRSKIDNVILDGNKKILSPTVFGHEPPHSWCFYYQKAQLARQQADWNTIAKIQLEVTRLNLHPNDQIEWMPFLQAAAVLGDEKQMKEIATRLNTEQLYKKQACRNLKAMSELKSEIQSYVDELFCGGVSQ